MSSGALVLHRRMRTLGQGALHCREVELCLAEDGRHVVLSRYVERFSQEGADWCSVHHHRVALVDMVRWMVENGES
ncbi:hypothetical protein [Pseudomonas citrulli]|uniref:Uncharacterized protein n=1 Tax=Pseudomonas citrulli TaxID=3064347 RepID=A0ABT9BVT8_9PSED|nr:hypothetical protein [Pseudomonas sp. K18]MDO7896064.1 hypothetical protein [Pseudomonas sp. K18]